MLPLTFVLPTPVPISRQLRPSVSPLRPRRTTVAVLDTPAGNTYLKRHAELIIRDFLTRRSVNTVMFYMDELGDGPSRDFLKRFDAFDTKVKNDEFEDGDGYLDRMMHAQNQNVEMTISHMGGRLKRTYKFKIEPRRIADRIFDVRKQIASEWATDLRCIEMENVEIQRTEFEKVLTKDQQVLDSKKNIVFDMDPFSDNTPLRYKNYMALKTLLTQHSVARLLWYMRDEGSNHEYMYLLQFTNTYGAISNGDDFIRQLMQRQVEFRTHPSFTIQPRSIALQILEVRQAIADEWIALMQRVPEEQMELARSILERSMGMPSEKKVDDMDN